MIEYEATVRWQNDEGPDFPRGRYSRAHTWEFDEGLSVPASSSPHSVRVPWSQQDAVDPEEALVASCSACHMLTFLRIAARRKFVIDSYVDEAIGYLSKNEKGDSLVDAVDLRPRIQFSGPNQPDAQALDEMHHEAHEECIIANSVRCEIRWNSMTGEP